MILSPLAGCTFKPAPKTQKLTISFPKEVTRPTPNLASKNGVLSPRAETLPNILSEFQCIGVNVVAGDIPSVNRSDSCAPTAVEADLSEIAQIVPRSTGSISLEIPKGYSRKIQIFGVTSSDGVCPTIAQVLTPPEGAGVSQKSKPYQLAAPIVDLTDDTVVNATLVWDPNSPKIAFCSKAFTDSASCAYGAKFDCSNWDQALWAN